MIAKYCCYIFITVCVISCRQKVDVNKIVLPIDEEKVIEILADIRYAQAAVDVDRKFNADSLLNVYESQVLEIHNVDRQTYDKLVKILEGNLEKFYEIESKVHTYLKNVESNNNISK